MTIINFPKSVEQRTINTLESSREPCCGFLMGRCTDDTVDVIGSFHCLTTNDDDIRFSMMEAVAHFPGGLGVCGMYFSYSPNTGEDAVMRNIRHVCSLLKVSEENLIDSCLLISSYQSGLSGTLTDNLFWYHVESRDMVRVEEKVNIDEEDSIWQGLMMFRIQTTCVLTLPYSKDEAAVKKSLAVELGLEIDRLKSRKTSYHVNNSRILLHNDDDYFCSDDDNDKSNLSTAFCGISEDEVCSEMFHFLDTDDEGQFKTRRKIKDYSQEIINVSVLRRATPRNESETSAFLIYVDEERAEYLRVNVPIDCLVLVSAIEADTVGNLPTLFTRSITNQIASLGRCMSQFYKDHLLPKARPVHIKPLGLNHPLTVYYPDGYTDDQLVDLRHCLQVKLHLAVDRPLLKVSNRFILPDERKGLLYLQNTHLGLPKSGVKDGCVSCVQGVYSYHHYMQDGMNDNGWGCAYRSLQTVISWFRHQGYTQVAVPTHKQIQQALVEVGDKEASFVGSRQWIGSTEVGFCLDHLLGVTSKFMFVSAGRELADKGRELALHFTSQGTPIMIGGGVLAHTILGVDFNDSTGDVKFLILDPHYTGQEDLKEIQSKVSLENSYKVSL